MNVSDIMKHVGIHRKHNIIKAMSADCFGPPLTELLFFFVFDGFSSHCSTSLTFSTASVLCLHDDWDWTACCVLCALLSCFCFYASSGSSSSSISFSRMASS